MAYELEFELIFTMKLICIIKVNMCYMSAIDPEVKHNISIQKTKVIIPFRPDKVVPEENHIKRQIFSLEGYCLTRRVL